MNSQSDSLLDLLLAPDQSCETGFDPDAQSPYLRFALDSDPTVFLWAFTNTGEIRIRFTEGGFIKHGFFRFINATAFKGVDDDDSVATLREEHDLLILKYPRGRVTVMTAAKPLTGGLRMAVQVTLPGDERRTVQKLLSERTCKEIEFRLKQVEALLKTYLEEYEEEDEGDREESNGVVHAVAS